MKHLILTFSLLLPLVLSLTLQEDDLVFDDIGEETSATVIHGRKDHERLRDNKKHHVERLWGIPDVAVAAGHVFKLKIPKQAFSGNVDRYEVYGVNGKPLSRWLYWDEPASTILGVPTGRDTGLHRVSVKAFGKHGAVAKDAFTIDVTPEKRDVLAHKDGKTHCYDGEDQTLLTILLDTRLDSLKPAARVDAIENLAGFLGLHTNAFSIHPHGSKEALAHDTSIILSGPGNVKHRREKHLTAIQWQVGCDGHLWRHQTNLVKQLREQAKDGTLSEVLQLPVLLWRVKTDSDSPLRNRREIGSGDYGDYDGYDEDYDDGDYEDGEEEGDDNESITESPLEPPFVSGARENVEGQPEHPHRHHHGEETIDWKVEDIDEHDIVPIDSRIVGTDLNKTTSTTHAPKPSTTTTQPTTTTTPITTTRQPTTTASTTVASTMTTRTTTTTTTAAASTTVDFTTVASTAEPPRPDTTEESAEKTKRIDVEFETIVPTISSEPTTIPPLMTTTEVSITSEVANATEKPDSSKTTMVIVNVTTEESIEQPTMPSTRQATTLPPMTRTLSVNDTTTTTSLPTRQPYDTMTTTSITNITTAGPVRIVPTTEEIEYKVNNFPPRQDRRLKKISVIAGKPLSYIIPKDTFSDLEDGDTRKLRLSLHWQGNPIDRTHWLQFNRQTQEVYGLPLVNDISMWDYELVAADSEGLNVSDTFFIYVQQHTFSRIVNHEFSIYLKIDKSDKFPTNVDWEMKVIQSLAELYGDNNTNQITVRSIDIDEDRAIFTWTNDSLSRSLACPNEQINKLLHILVANKDGEPSILLKKALSPQMKVERVVYQGIGQCENMNKPESPSIPTQEPKSNYPPVPRNQVDHINATVGQLLVFTVPEDTFFDPEDGSARNMKMSLLTIDRTPIPQQDWLQFDGKNQEFYGVPLHKDVGRKEYQLIVTDKEGVSATDSLVVVVHPASTMRHNVEFSMTLEIPYDSFAYSSLKKRNFIEKLRDLFDDRDTSAISLDSVTNGSTIVTWHNRTLPTANCPNEEITRLREVLVKDDKTLTDRVEEVMGPDFPVMQITLTPMGICLGELTGIHSPDSFVPPVDDSTPTGASHDDYLITFVLPAIIIAAMLILAGIIACVLYRRRRSGKMSVSEQDDERQSFRNKGIPVIFQDELDEKPDPGNKSPVILKEEKPPLPPPEYQKTEDGADVPMLQKENSEEPYHPPPPFTTNRDNNRQNRPKPTPTYRKPPPYVPP